MKKHYVAPAMETMKIAEEAMICASDLTVNGIPLGADAGNGEEFAPERPEDILGLGSGFSLFSF